MVSDFRPHESYQFFLQEAPDLLQQLEMGLLNLQGQPDQSQFWELMRTAHSIKGGAACVGLSGIQNLAHRLETLFQTAAETKVHVDTRLEELLLQGFDQLKGLLLAEIRGIAPPAPNLSLWLQLYQKLQIPVPERWLESPATDRVPGADWSPEDNPTDVGEAVVEDVVQFLFQVDVEKGLTRLQTLLQDYRHNSPLAGPTTAEPLLSVITQVQIFRGIGEITSLPGFVNLADTALAAFAQQPQQLLAIGEQALNDFRTAQQAVLQGDRVLGGKSSAALRAFLSSATASTATASTATASSVTANSATAAAIPYPEQPSTLPRPDADSAVVNFNLPSASSSTGKLFSYRQDAAQMGQLNLLIGEMVTLENRLQTQNQQHEATLSVAYRSYGRLRHLLQELARRQQPLVNQHNQQSLVNLTTAPDWSASNLEWLLEELAQLGEAFKDLDMLGQQYQQSLRQRQKLLHQVQTNLLQVQMLPVGELLNQFPRVVRDLAVQEGKQVRLQLQGTNTLIERNALEQLYDPLVHLVRNAIDHGIESPALRESLGKSVQAVITIRAWHQGRHIFLEVSDDGRGIDRERVRQKALERGWLAAEENSLATASDQQLDDFLFAPNFSTADTVSRLSGRGMGLYAVQSQLQTMEGMISVQSRAGRGTCFTLRLPLNSILTKLVFFRVKQQRYALPTDTLVAITNRVEGSVQIMEGESFYCWKREFVPIVTLTGLTIYSYPHPSLTQQQLGQQQSGQQAGLVSPSSLRSEPSRPAEGYSSPPLLIMARGGQVVALQADEILTEQELVIKPFNDATLEPSPLLRGCTFLGDGQLVPVLDSSALIERWLQRSQNPSRLAIVRSYQQRPLTTVPIILVIDDSLTIRHALSLTLRKAGYQVLQAKDGMEGLQVLQQQTGIAGVICDIEMPRLNGLEFLSRCRQQGRTLPIIILTYRNSHRYHQLAEQLGATAYLTKPYLDQELLSVIGRALKASRF